MPKLRVWYSKDDYKKEREKELARLAALETQIQTEEQTAVVHEPPPEAPAPAIAVDPEVQKAEAEMKAALAAKQTTQPLVAEPQAEQEAPSSSEGNQAPNEIPPSPVETEPQTTEITPQAEPVHEATVPETVTGKTAPETVESQPAETLALAESPTAEAPPVESPPPMESEAQPPLAPVEGEVQTVPEPSESQTPAPAEAEQVQMETPEVPVEPIMPTETPESIPLENEPAPVEAVTPLVEDVKEESVELDMQVPLTDSVESIEHYTAKLKTPAPTKAVICIGEYPINIFLRGNWASKKEVLPIFMEKSSKEIAKWGQGHLDRGSIVGIDEEIDTHFWYDIMPYVFGNDGFMEKIKAKPLEKMQGAIIVSSTWNGVGSALLPTLNGQFAEWNVNSVALALLPSKAQPLDGQFNSLSSLGVLASKEGATTVIIDRDNLEEFTGVDSNGNPLKGNLVTNYLLDLMLSKETFVSELRELSKAFDAKMFTVMFAPGMSFKIYNTIENILNTTLVRPLLAFDLSTTTLIYVLVRMPFHLKDKLPRDKIEMAVANWFKDKADLESLQVAAPVYTEDSSDRIDIALFMGGFDVATRFAALEKRVERMKNKAVKKGLIKEEDWKLIAKSLVE